MSRPYLHKVKSMSLNALDEPYTSPDDDPFSAHSHLQAVQERKIHPPRAPYARLGLGSSSNPYLAYPDLPRIPSKPCLRRDDSTSCESYDFVEDDDIPFNAKGLSLSVEPVTPVQSRTSRFKYARHSLTPSLNLSLRSNSPSPSHGMDAVSRALSRIPLFPRSPRSNTPLVSSSSMSTTPQHQHQQPSHARSPSLSSSIFTTRTTPTQQQPTSKWRSPHFRHQASGSMSSFAVSEPHSVPSRPSISSAELFSTSNATTTTLDSGIALSPTKASFFNSLRLRGNRSTRTVSSNYSSQQLANINQEFTTSSYTLSPRRTLSPISLDDIDDEDDLYELPTYRFSRPEPTPSISSSRLKRVKFSSIGSRSGKKKKKLIVSGIGATEYRKIEGVKRWCESFGELRSITRLPNGDLQIDFRDPEVADTVCRIRAKVFIAGVGSVQLSWIVGNKR